MTIRSGHYTALLETIGARGATKLHAMSASSCSPSPDALLFGDPDSEQALARALERSLACARASAGRRESCAELREHLHGCGALPRGPELGAIGQLAHTPTGPALSPSAT